MGDKARFTEYWEQVILRVGKDEEKIRVECESKAHARRMTLIFYKVRKGLTDPDLKVFADRIVTHVEGSWCEFVPDAQTWYSLNLKAALAAKEQPLAHQTDWRKTKGGVTVPQHPNDPNDKRAPWDKVHKLTGKYIPYDPEPDDGPDVEVNLEDLR